jgi:rhomboid family GlyGly-CTERM serine protease
MKTQQIPILTLSLILLLVGLYFWVPDRTLFYFSSEHIAHGESWRVVTGHLMHADIQHLLWNILGLAVLGTLLELHSQINWWAALLVGIASVSTLLMSPFSQLDYYCGLSGVLNTLLLVVLWLEWRLTRSWLIVVITVGSIAKAVIEVSLGESLMTHISWPPYAWSHVAGLTGGLIIVWAQNKYRPLLHFENE